KSDDNLAEAQKLCSRADGGKAGNRTARHWPRAGRAACLKGCDRAYVILGQFLVVKKDKEMFTDWLNDQCNANTKQAGDCYNGLVEWCNAFL
ncbi:hypothetical protein BOX15_Mlig024511g3, partial [Macrostomum lignano]